VLSILVKVHKVYMIFAIPYEPVKYINLPILNLPTGGHTSISGVQLYRVVYLTTLFIYRLYRMVQSHRSQTMHLRLLLGFIFSSTIVCQSKITTAFTDAATGISFQRFFGAKTNFGFGVALPQNTTSNSFIGQLTFPLKNSAGWGGWSLTGDMEGPLLMAAWSDGKNVVSSFRQAKNEDDNPPEVTGTFTVRPIAQGTSVNSSFLTYTFLCEGCLDAAFGLSAAATASTVEMGWALANTAVGNPGTSAGVLGFHNSGFGGFDAQLNLAKSAEFDSWAAMAGTPLLPSAGAVPISANAGDGDDGDDDEEDSDDDNAGGDDSDDDD